MGRAVMLHLRTCVAECHRCGASTVLLELVVRAVCRGEFDDWEGPAARHTLDADGCPERDAERDL